MPGILSGGSRGSRSGHIDNYLCCVLFPGRQCHRQLWHASLGHEWGGSRSRRYWGNVGRHTCKVNANWIMTCCCLYLRSLQIRNHQPELFKKKAWIKDKYIRLMHHLETHGLLRLPKVLVNMNILLKRMTITNAPNLLNVSINIKKQPQRKSFVHMHKGSHFCVVLWVADFT